MFLQHLVEPDKMIDPNQLLSQFLGKNNVGNSHPTNQPTQQGSGGNGLTDMLGGSFGKGAAAGGVLGLLLGNKKMRKMGGKALLYGGAAAAGLVAYKAWQGRQGVAQPSANYSATAPSPATSTAQEIPPDTNQSLRLIKAMIGAAKADGHIDASEQTAIFQQVESMSLDAEAKACIFDCLSKPVSLAELSEGVGTMEEASQIYVVSRLAIDLDHPAEKAWLDALAQRLQIPADLRQNLDQPFVEVESSNDRLSDSPRPMA
ncbi:protein YebE [Pseudohongiella nitratireducens]|jgi:uncharacterized membrane protein YebE (DUF533 family)|uniref:Protein YebE n=2 Tax=Pseudohongiella nitratireducens TaxID=1768907 RepID=A0A917GKN2_9GAMM|nr:protein YebE [Pseudohongiella nitratireducens]